MESEKDNNIMIEEIINTKTPTGELKINCWSDSNGDVKPRGISKNSRKNYIFLCDVCNHEFTETILNIVQKNKWCPFCNLNKLCNDLECEICYNNSFASCKE